MIKCICN